MEGWGDWGKWTKADDIKEAWFRLWCDNNVEASFVMLDLSRISLEALLPDDWISHQDRKRLGL